MDERIPYLTSMPPVPRQHDANLMQSVSVWASIPPMKPTSNPYKRFYPIYWPVWLLLGLLRTTAWLPFHAQLVLGRGIGTLFRWIAPSRRRVVDTNLSLCFPELDPAERKKLRNKHFRSLGIGLMETANCWWGNTKKLEPLIEVKGLDNLDAAEANGRGVILLSGHFTNLEIGGRFMTMFREMSAVYRPHEHPVIGWAMQKNRERHAANAIQRDDVRSIIRTLKSGGRVWYAPDQARKFKGQWALIPFMGEPAVTNIATSKIAKMTGAAVVPFFCSRQPGSQGYVLELLPALANFPSDDVEQDALRVNQTLEEKIRQVPEQYWWVHKKFKRRETLPDPYKD